jgi:putative nucleotidyltransferase with HDIG domain
MSQILSLRVGRREDQALYTAALLHDIGKVILGEFVHEALPKIRILVAEGNRSFLEAEEEVIGINHAEVGGRIAAHWHFPEDITAAIAHHHRPDLLEKSDDVIPWLVYFSDHLCRMIGIDGGLDSLHHRALAEALQKFNFRIIDLEWSFVQLWRDMERAKELISIT